MCLLSVCVLVMSVLMDLSSFCSVPAALTKNKHYKKSQRTVRCKEIIKEALRDRLQIHALLFMFYFLGGCCTCSFTHYPVVHCHK